MDRQGGRKVQVQDHQVGAEILKVVSLRSEALFQEQEVGVKEYGTMKQRFHLMRVQELFRVSHGA